MAKITINDVTEAQKAIWKAHADAQGITEAELFKVHTDDFARNMGIDVTDDEATQLADLKRVTDKRAAKRAAREAEAEAAKSPATPTQGAE